MTPRHHTVPQFYLRNFADSGGKVTLVDRDQLHDGFPASVRNVAAEAGFYRIEVEQLERAEDRVGFDPEGVEAALSALEAEAAPALRRVVDCGVADLAQEDWYRLIQFAAIQTVRGNRWRTDFSAIATSAARVTLLERLDPGQVRSWLAERGLASEPEDVAAFIAGLSTSKFPRVIPPQEVLVQQSFRMAIGDGTSNDIGLGQYLAEKTLELIATERTAILTSDEPVCWWSPGDGPIGYATAHLVWIPLTPRLILQFREREFEPTAHDLPDISSPAGRDEMGTVVNRLVAAQAERWIIHHPDDAPLPTITIPSREVWGDELVGVEDDASTRREVFVHRRLRVDSAHEEA